MERRKGLRTIGEVAAAAGVSVRTLRLYDELGLLSPSGRTAAGYRLYGEEDLLRLQQILFFRELELPLGEIKAALDHSGLRYAETLIRHRRSLQHKAERIGVLLRTLDRTIAGLKGEEPMPTIDELYKGFDRETAERYEAEAEENWGDTDAYRQSRKRIAAMSKDEWAAVRARGDAITDAFAAACRAGENPGGPLARELCARWVDHLRSFYDPTPELLGGLAALYVDNPDFRSAYEAKSPGLASWISAALGAYARRPDGER